MIASFFHPHKAFDGVTQSVSQLLYQLDQQSIGRVAHWTKDKLGRFVDNYTPSKYKNDTFGGFFHKITLILSRYLGSQDVKNIDTLRARVWLEKPLEFLKGSRILTARRIYDSIAQNFHAEKAIPEVVEKICKQSLNHYNRNNDRTNPGQILREKLKTTITKLVQGPPFFTMAQAASKISEVALPEVIEQGLRIFLVTSLWSLYTNSPFLSTIGTVCFLTTATNLIGNMPPAIQVYAYFGTGFFTLCFSSNTHWLSTIPSVCTLAIWWGLIANGRTDELAAYKPPESANQVEHLVRDNMSTILDEIELVLDPDQKVGRRGLDDVLEKIKFSAYPFTPFEQKEVSQSLTKHVTIEPSKKTEEKKTERPLFQDAEDATKKFVNEHRNNEELPEYWILVNKEYEMKAKHYSSKKEWGKYVTCIIRIETARIEYFDLTVDIESFKREIVEVIDRVNKKLTMPELKNNKRLLDFIEEVKTRKHKDDA